MPRNLLKGTWFAINVGLRVTIKIGEYNLQTMFLGGWQTETNVLKFQTVNKDRYEIWSIFNTVC